MNYEFKDVYLSAKFEIVPMGPSVELIWYYPVVLIRFTDYFYLQDEESVSTNPENKNVESLSSHVKPGKNVFEGKLEIIYKINDVPPWHMCILLGFQVSVFLFWVFS